MSSHDFSRNLESHLNEAIVRAEDRVDEHIDWRAVRVAGWGVAAASVFGAVAAGFAAIGAAAGAVILVRKALQHEDRNRGPRIEQVSAPATPSGASIVKSQSSVD